MKRKKVAIIGAGAAGLMAACVLSPTCEVHLYEKGKTAGRKFLVAGNGGFNLSNHLTGQELLDKYSDNTILHRAIERFDSTATRQWLSALGLPTYIGSSGRIFPEKGIKPALVLKKIIDFLKDNGVVFNFHHQFIGFDEKQTPLLENNGVENRVDAEHYIFALGGASWSITGSDGNWTKAFNKIDVQTLPFQASNCGLNIQWPQMFIQQYEGKPLKNIRVSVGDKYISGEAMITQYGIEGNAIYPLVPEVRELLNQNKSTQIFIDLKPQQSYEQLLAKIQKSNFNSKDYGKLFNLDKCQLDLIKTISSKEDFMQPELFVKFVKQISLHIDSLRPIEEAISTIGGIPFSEINADFSLKKYPHIRIAGEMLDWDAPTGGFLLQACFSSGYAAASALI